MSEAVELLIELGFEELPARMVGPAAAGFAEGVLGLLEGLSHGAVRTYATPRRLAVVVEGLATHQPTTERELMGPPADKAFTDGVPNEAGVAFARSRGADPATLRVVEVPKRGAVAVVTVREGGKAAAEVLAAGLAGVIAKVPFPKTMVWGDGGLSWARPLHRVTVLLGGKPVAGEAHGIGFNDQTIGHRLAAEPVAVTDEAGWLAALRARFVEPDLAARRARIQDELDRVSASLGADPIRNDELLDEVVNLVEWPVAVVGTFDADLLDLPPRLLVTSMRVHQRYFPIYKAGSLTNQFVVISNNPFASAEVIAEGNARVLRARFFDARFFLREDLAKPLEAHGAKLSSMRWIRGLGTMAEKAARVGALADRLGELLPGLGADPATLRRAAALCKCDLATQMVGEFPELQGHVGRLYAARQGEGEAVAVAIEEHYLPRFSGDDVAVTPAGRLLALAERLDTLVGCFGVGLEPRGGGDPQGLRRAAVGSLQTLLAVGVHIDLGRLFAAAVEVFHGEARSRDGFEAWRQHRGDGAAAKGGEAVVAALVEFALARWKASRVEAGLTGDLVDAVLHASTPTGELVQLDAKLTALADLAGTPTFAPVLITVKRVLNILGAERRVGASIDPADCPEAVERELLELTAQVRDRVLWLSRELDFAGVFAAVTGLAPAVDRFFVGVMVNDPDLAVRARRVGILAEVAELFASVADFSRISTR